SKRDWSSDVCSSDLAALAGAGLLRGAKDERQSEEKEIEVGPPEDLMREHGVLKRVLLIYGEALRRLDAKQDFPPDALADAAGIRSEERRVGKDGSEA